jgi:hypothetical protein
MPNINAVDESELDMTNQDRNRLDSLEKKVDDHIRDNRGFMESLNEKFDRWDDLYYAFTGNKLDNKAGMINRINTIETKLLDLEGRILKLESAHTKIITYAIGTSFAVSVAWKFIGPQLGL